VSSPPAPAARPRFAPALSDGYACAQGGFSEVGGAQMNVKIVVHEAEEGGYWAEVPALPGCASQGESMDELLANMREAIQAWLDTPDGEPAWLGPLTRPQANPDSRPCMLAKPLGKQSLDKACCTSR
jgi:predicted RNase H-like HicB family nuclease